MPRDRFEHDAGTEKEHAAVPEVVAASHILFGSFPIGLLDEARDATHAVAHVLAGLEISEPGLRASRLDANRRDGPFRRRSDRALDRRAKRRLVADVMVAGKHHDHRILAAAARHGRGPADTWSRVACEGLAQERAFGQPRQRTARLLEQVLPRGDQRALGRAQRFYAPHGCGDQALVRARPDGQELLRAQSA